MKIGPRFKFRLYVVGDAPNSLKAIAKIHALCEEHLAGRHEIEIIDVLLEPKRALNDGVLMTPLLVRVSPKPTWKILGNLSQDDSLLEMMGEPI
jgi:circadian clock protein KaiB